MTLEKNMQYKICLHKQKLIEKDTAKIPAKYVSHIFDSLEFFSKNGLPNLSVKKLNNYKLAWYRLRVWDYRVLFDIDEEKKEIMIFRILHRSKLY